MAEVDFTNATLSLVSNPMNGNAPLNLYSIYNSNRQPITSSINRATVLKTTEKDLYKMSGAFSNSGTEFYIGNSSESIWKVENVSFQSGDTFEMIFSLNIT